MDRETEKILNLVVQNGYRCMSVRLAIIATLVNSAGHITAT